MQDIIFNKDSLISKFITLSDTSYEKDPYWQEQRVEDMYKAFNDSCSLNMFLLFRLVRLLFISTGVLLVSVSVGSFIWSILYCVFFIFIPSWTFINPREIILDFIPNLGFAIIAVSSLIAAVILIIIGLALLADSYKDNKDKLPDVVKKNFSTIYSLWDSFKNKVCKRVVYTQTEE